MKQNKMEDRESRKHLLSYREGIIHHRSEEEEVRDGFTEEVAFEPGVKRKTRKVASRQQGEEKGRPCS